MEKRKMSEQQTDLYQHKLFKDYNDAVANRDTSRKSANRLFEAREELAHQHDNLNNSKGLVKAIGQKVLLRKYDIVHDQGLSQQLEAKVYEKERKAALWDSHEHLEANREVYEQAAIEDANAAGHDIKFGGENHPADSTERPQQ